MRAFGHHGSASAARVFVDALQAFDQYLVAGRERQAHVARRAECRARHQRHQLFLQQRVGQLQIVFEEPSASKFVVSPNAPVRQIWVSALSRSFKLAWSPEASTFALDGEPLDALIERLAQQFISRT